MNCQIMGSSPRGLPEAQLSSSPLADRRRVRSEGRAAKLTLHGLWRQREG